MDIGLIVALVFVLLFVLLFLGTHLGLAMSSVAILGTSLMIGYDSALSLAGLSIFEAAQSFDLSVIPLFVLMGCLASRSGISSDLFAAFHSWLGRYHGGLAHASIAACAAFGAVCGSSLATAATMGQIALPEMKRFGYSDRLATGSIAAGGTIGILIPPSVIMLIYGILTETSIGDLFIAGIIPGILLTLLFMATVVVIVKVDKSVVPEGSIAKASLTRSTLAGVWATLLLFALVIGGIYGGFFTPTEAAGFGAAGAIVIGLVMKRLNMALIIDSLMDTIQTTAMIFLILIGAILFSGFLSLSSTPSMLGDWVVGLNLSPIMTIILIVFIYLLLGAFLDTMAMIILSIPIFFPIVSGMGFDPVWFGVLVVVVVELALITPPMGINVFVIKGLAKDTPLIEIFRGVWPFCVALLVLIALIIAFPSIVTFLPELAR
jgi:C4-dicarboxylate transporter, DctM subunit